MKYYVKLMIPRLPTEKRPDQYNYYYLRWDTKINSHSFRNTWEWMSYGSIQEHIALGNIRKQTSDEILELHVQITLGTIDDYRVRVPEFTQLAASYHEDDSFGKRENFTDHVKYEFFTWKEADMQR